VTAGDREVVAGLLGREPRGFEVVVRDRAGVPVVISNPPILDDSTPMPTRYWLVGKEVTAAVSRLEAGGGVKQAEAAVDPQELAAAHDRYARRGVKCLHAHLAWYLVGGDDPVGRWVAEQLDIDRGAYELEGVEEQA
jgi:hypothetical protein